MLSLARKTFQKSVWSKRDKEIIWILHTRAWVVFAGWQAVRVVQIVTGTSGWYKRDADCTSETAPEDLEYCIALYNKELCDPVRAYLMILATGLVIVYIFFCIACYWRRDLAMYFMYLECFIRVVASFIPNAHFAPDTSLDYMWAAIVMFLSFYSDRIGQTISVTILLIFQSYFVPHVIYLKALTYGIVLIDLGVILAFIFCTTMVGILISYVLLLQSSLDFANQEHVRLLNGMHEGLLILTNSPDTENRSVLFCN